MKEDQQIEALFRGFDPELGPETDFMDTLNRKLDAVEYIKQVQETQLRCYKRMILATFVAGVAAGALLFALFVTLPEQIQLFAFDGSALSFTFSERDSRLILLAVLSAAMGGSIINLVHAFGEILAIRAVNRPAVS